MSARVVLLAVSLPAGQRSGATASRAARRDACAMYSCGAHLGQTAHRARESRGVLAVQRLAPTAADATSFTRWSYRMSTSQVKRRARSAFPATSRECRRAARRSAARARGSRAASAARRTARRSRTRRRCRRAAVRDRAALDVERMLLLVDVRIASKMRCSAASALGADGGTPARCSSCAPVVDAAVDLDHVEPLLDQLDRRQECSRCRPSGYSSSGG